MKCECGHEYNNHVVTQNGIECKEEVKLGFWCIGKCKKFEAEFKYPKGHNWEGMTPEEVKRGYEANTLDASTIGGEWSVANSQHPEINSQENQILEKSNISNELVGSSPDTFKSLIAGNPARLLREL